MSRCSQQDVTLCFCRAHLTKVSQLLRSSTTIFNVMLLVQLTFLRSTDINCNPSWNEINYIKTDTSWEEVMPSFLRLCLHLFVSREKGNMKSHS